MAFPLPHNTSTPRSWLQDEEEVRPLANLINTSHEHKHNNEYNTTLSTLIHTLSKVENRTNMFCLPNTRRKEITL